MIDLHCHLLPGVDDGPRQLDEAVEMCRRAAADGCTALVATPHQRHESWWNDDRALLERRFAELVEAVGDGPELHLGAEIHVDAQLLTELERLPDADVLPLADSRYLLLELALFHRQPEPAWIAHEVRLLGRLPIFAHAELIPSLAEDPARAGRAVEAGAFLQITATSLLGEYGPSIQAICERWLDAGLVHFVASDAHDLTHRPPGLAAAYDHLVEQRGEATARRLLADNPAAVLADRELD